MEKKDKIYYENLYLAHLRDVWFNEQRTDENAEKKLNESMASTTKFFNDGLNTKVEESYKPDTETYFKEKNNKNYNKFARKNVGYWNSVVNGDTPVEDEIERMNKRQLVKRNLNVVAGTVATIGLLTACIVGLTKCSNNKKNKPSQTTTNGVTSGSLDDTTNPSEKRPTFTNYDMSSAIVDTNGSTEYSINNETYPDYEDGEVVYGLYTDPWDGSNDVIESTFDPSFPSMTQVNVDDIKVTPTPVPTQPTGTTTTQTQETINSQGETVPTTSVETEPRYSESDDGRDVVENIYDEVQPAYIEEDINETYTTYTTFDETTSTTTATTTSTYTTTTSSMVVEYDEDETYETYMTFDTKEANQTKGRAKVYRRK